MSVSSVDFYMPLQTLSVGDALSSAEVAFRAVRLLKLTEDQCWRSFWFAPWARFENARNSDELLAELQQELKVNCPQFFFKGGNWLLSFPPRGNVGFQVDLIKSGTSSRAWFGEMEVEFSSIEEGLTWVARAASGEYRLRTTIVSGRPREWHLEPANGTSSSVLASGFPIYFRSMRALQETIQHNSVTNAS